MKKTKLLTSLAALALVLGLGACTEPEDGGTTEESSETTQTTESSTDTETTTSETSSENASESESTSQSTSNPGSTSEPNYTYAVVVNNAEQLSSILEYDADDDSHQIFSLDVTLYTYEESGEVHESRAATASDVVVSDYDDDLFGFDGLTGYVNGAGTSSVTITWTGYAATTIELTVTDITRSHDDDEIAMEIINSIKENGVEWDAVHAETIDGTDDYQDSEIVDVAVDENGNILGQWSCFEDEWLSEQEFYKDGKIFYFEAAEDEDEDDDYDWDYLEDGDMSIDDIIDYWSLALDALERVDVTDRTNPYMVDSFDYLDDGYRLVLAEKGSDDRTYTYVVDKEYKLTGYGLQFITSQNNYYMVEWAIESTLEDVQTVMDEQFDISLWDIEDDEDLEIAQAILDAASETGYLEWDAVHAEEYDDEDPEATVYLAYDENDDVYGYWYQYDLGDLESCYYYYGGTRYEYDPEEDEYTISGKGSLSDIDNFLDDYGEALEEAEDIDLEDDKTEYTLEETNEGGYSLTVEVSQTNVYNMNVTYSYTYVVDSDYEIVALGEYVPDFVGSYSGYYAEKSTLEVVKDEMSKEFDITNWGVEEDQDLEIVLSILQWATQTDEYDIPELWDAVHIDDIEYDWDEEDEYWITIQDDALYGRFEQSGIEDTSYSETRYFMNNYYFSIQNEEGDIDYDYDTYYEDYEDIIDAYTYPIADAENFLDEDDDGDLILSEDVYSYELIENSDGGYTLKLTYGDWWGRDSATIYTYTTDENLDVYKIEYEEGSIEEEDYEYNLLEWITKDEVESQMSDFDVSLWIN